MIWPSLSASVHELTQLSRWGHGESADRHARSSGALLFPSWANAAAAAWWPGGRSPRLRFYASSSSGTSLVSCSTSQGWCVQGDNRNAMKSAENGMKVAGYVFFFLVFWWFSFFLMVLFIFPNVLLPFWLPEQGPPHCGVDGALCWVAVMMQVDQLEVGEVTRAFRMLRSLPLGGATPFAVFPEEADTLEQRGFRESSFNQCVLWKLAKCTFCYTLLLNSVHYIILLRRLWGNKTLAECLKAIMQMSFYSKCAERCTEDLVIHTFLTVDHQGSAFIWLLSISWKQF